MTRSTGFNVQRQLIGGIGQHDTSQERRDQYQGGPAPTIQRAVVVDVIYDPTALTDDQLNALEDKVANPEVVGLMPYNSIIGRIITNEHDLGDPTPFIFFPFFSSHMQLPIKPGEQVFIIYEDFSYRGNTLGYWMTRAPAARLAEDLNYTHGDRLFDPANNVRNLDSTQRSNITASAPTFPNGAGTPESFSLQPSGSTNPYDDIVGSATASMVMVFEPVPRQRKRPGDFSFFGSNNAGIMIGRDRTGPVLSITGSGQQLDVLSGSGTIDLVAGLGAPRKPPTADNPPSTDNHNPTAAKVIANSRSVSEADKTPFKNQGAVDNATEGDPDFKRDLSRVYISMKTKGDKNFGINLGNDNSNSNGIFTASDSLYGTKIEDLAAGDTDGQPFVVIKSEHVRIIGTGKDADNGPDNSGDIRIIKEGKITDDPRDFGMLTLASDGRVMLQGKKVYVQMNDASGDADNARIFLGCKDDTSSEADPIVLYTKLKTTLDDIIDKVHTFAQDTYTALNNLSTNLTGTSAAGPFSPIPKVNVAAGLLSSDVSTVNQDVSAINDLKSSTSDSAHIADIPSKHVFVKKTGKND